MHSRTSTFPSIDDIDLDEIARGTQKKPQFEPSQPPDVTHNSKSQDISTPRSSQESDRSSLSHRVQEPVIKDWKSWYFNLLPNNFYIKTFVGVSLLSAAIVLALEIYITVLFFQNTASATLRKKAIATYLALFICAEIYQIIITVSAVISKSRTQVFLLLAFIACMVVYTGVQFAEMKTNLAPYLPEQYRSRPQAMIIAIICLEIATFLAQTYLFTFHLRKDFAWRVFKTVGAAPEDLKRLSQFQTYRALLYFDGFFFPAFTLQFIIMMPKVEVVEFVLTIIVIPVSILLLISADYFASNEIVSGSLICMFCYLLGLVYAFFKVVRIYTHNTDASQYYPGRKSLTEFAVFSIILLFLSLIFGTIVISNFDKGLKPFVARKFLGKHKNIDPSYDTVDIEKDDMEISPGYNSYKGGRQESALVID